MNREFINWIYNRLETYTLVMLRDNLIISEHYEECAEIKKVFESRGVDPSITLKELVLNIKTEEESNKYVSEFITMAYELEKNGVKMKI